MGDDRVFRFQLQYVPEQEHFLARAPELGIEAEAATRGEALTQLEAAVDEEVERRAVAGEALPRPADLVTEAGTVELELAAPVYRDLLTHAAAQGLEPEGLALQLLTGAIARLDGRGPRRKNKPAAEGAAAPEKTETQSPDAAPPKEGEAGRRKKNRGRNRRREGYRPDMDDQANFLAYVRDQERGGRGGR